MSDPAIEAAQWAHIAHGDAPVFCDDCAEPAVETSIAATQRALAPIRALHQPLWYLNHQHCCGTCYDGAGLPEIWPCDTARLCYTDDEIKEIADE